MNAGGEEHLVHVDVAQTRDDGLVEEQPLYGGSAFEHVRQILDRERLRKRVGTEARDQGVLLDAFRLVQVEVAKPEPGEGEYGTSLELHNRRVDLVRVSPFRQLQHTPRDNEMHQAHDIPKIQRNDLAAPPRILERAPREPALKLFGPDVRYVV